MKKKKSLLIQWWRKGGRKGKGGRRKEKRKKKVSDDEMSRVTEWQQLSTITGNWHVIIVDGHGGRQMEVVNSHN